GTAATTAAFALDRPNASGYESQSGATTNAANFGQPARAVAAPRAHGELHRQNPQIRNAGMMASFVFELRTYCVNGYAVHANTSVVASRVPPNLRPTSRSPARQSKSQRIDVACAAGSRSHFPLQP